MGMRNCEPFDVPTTAGGVAVLAYLVIVGSIALFMLFMYIIERWSASATAYALLIMPLVTLVGGLLLLGEEIRPIALVGGAVVLIGVYVGAFQAARGIASAT